MYRSIGNLEGQALAKVNIGNVLDSYSDWASALQSYEEGYRQYLHSFLFAVEADRPQTQLQALENMHYSNMVRFDKIEETDKLREKIVNLKQSLNKPEARDNVSDYCSETDTEGGNASDNMLPEEENDLVASKYSDEHDDNDDVTLASLVQKSRSSSKIKAPKIRSPSRNVDELCDIVEGTRTVSSRSCTNHSVGRKRVRVVLSDDEVEESHEILPSKKTSTSPADSMSISGTGLLASVLVSLDAVMIDIYILIVLTSPFHASLQHTLKRLLPPVEVASRHADQDNFRWQGITDMEGDSGREVVSIEVVTKLHGDLHISGPSESGEHLVYLDDRACVHDGGAFDIEFLKVEVACVYYLQISDDKKVKGLLPVIGELRYCGEVLDDAPPSIDYVDQLASEKKCVDVVIADWVPKRLLKLYVDFCKKLSEAPNKKLLRKLYNLEVSEDEVIVSDCGLQDLSITPFLNALRSHKTIAVLDLSHNLLGTHYNSKHFHSIATKLLKAFSIYLLHLVKTYGGLTLDLHCNRFGPTALFQICECAVMTERLEVLNLSGNRLTDACSSYIFTILQKCKGKNNPISGTAMLNLLSQTCFAEKTCNFFSPCRFSELSLTGIKLNKLMVDKLCSLAQSTCLSGFLLGGTSIGPVGTIRLTEVLSSASHELLRLELSNCGLTAPDFTQICTNLSRINILDLNIAGNSINLELHLTMQGCDAIHAMLVNPHCSIRSLTLDRCNLRLMGIVRIIQALSDNDQLEELRVAGNANFAQGAMQYDKDMQEVSTTTDQKQHNNSAVNNDIAPENIDFENMQVPDSEDEADNEKHRAGPHGSCASSSQRNQCYQVVEELVHALVSAKQLKVLDLSQNGLSDEVIQSLYSAWASGSRGDGTARKHVSKEVVHFSVDGMRCCGLKSCCRRDLQM
ncbi:hypothetical protein PR202_ga03195 [Eleusine coracana subsp. coracana]|uniref:Uncharacterized protein n=1 Tax=Eleusine coracana subsp. coracana TaxID=191504 RepID=A0AAV5BNU1_ELECO|nr:hypothetical protein PR202_ga03195 [Eleusine coracana subsp. coracana]